MLRRSGIVMAAFFLLTCIAWAQDNTYEVSLGGAAVLSKGSTGNGTTLDPTNSGAVVVTARYRFSDHHSVEINYAHTENSQIYFASPLTYRIQGTIAEYSGAYVYSFHESKKLEPFVFAGGAALIFYPGYNFNYVNNVQTYLPASQQTKPAFLYGGGVDWKVFASVPILRRSPMLSNHLALRLQYRGLIYKAPDFKIQNLFTGAKGHMAEPSVGIVVKF